MSNVLLFIANFDLFAFALLASLLLIHRFEDHSGIEVIQDPTDKRSPFYLAEDV